MSSDPTSTWVDAVRAATSGPALLAFLTRRFTAPYAEGPPLDDRLGEGPGRIFEELAADDDELRTRLEETIAGYFRSDEAAPEDEARWPVIAGLINLAQRLALAGTHAPLRAWLQRHELALSAEPGAELGRAALGALATTQLPGLSDMKQFWLRWWQQGPKAWRARAFIGLRLHDPRVAAEQIPALLALARGEQESPGPLLHGLWSQPNGGKTAIVEWLSKHSAEPDADEVRKALRARLPESDWADLRSPEPLRRPPSLAAAGKASWRQGHER